MLKAFNNTSVPENKHRIAAGVSTGNLRQKIIIQEPAPT